MPNKKSPPVGTKIKSWCAKCKEPTTQRMDKNPETGKQNWTCLCCESAKYRSADELNKLKSTLRGWAGMYCH